MKNNIAKSFRPETLSIMESTAQVTLLCPRSEQNSVLMWTGVNPKCH